MKQPTLAEMEAAILTAARIAAPLMLESTVNAVSIARNGRVLRVMTWGPDGSPVTAQVQIGGKE